MADVETFSAIALALYLLHGVGDYWVQMQVDALHKGDDGPEGRGHCARHVATYVLVQLAGIAVVTLIFGIDTDALSVLGAMAISGVTHYMADRREHGLMFRLARKIPGKADFLKLGVPRGHVFTGFTSDAKVIVNAPVDNPSLGTGAWALDQSWHYFWGIFVAAILCSLAWWIAAPVTLLLLAALYVTARMTR